MAQTRSRRVWGAVILACVILGVWLLGWAAGEVSGQPVRGYREEDNVPADSSTETFVAMPFLVITVEGAFKALIRAAVALNTSGGKARPRRAK